MNKVFKIKTLGCKVNQYETQLMREALLSRGYKEAEDGQRFQIYIINTCAVTAKAAKESRGYIRRYIGENKNAEVIVTGCYAVTEPEQVKAIDKRIKILTNTDKVCIKSASRSGISYFKGHDKAFVKIQDGCNNFCSFCIVPYARGRSQSRKPEEIIEETKRLIKNGYKEIVLSGICLGDFGKDLGAGITLTRLVRRISDIDGDFRIRLSSIELPDVVDDLIDEMANSTRLCHHLHIPLQSGDDEVLRRMNRCYGPCEFISRIDYIRRKIPDVAINTDVIVGFPGEKDSNFNNTIKAINEIRPSRTHIFTYSPHKQTETSEMPDDVEPKVKEQRYKQLKYITDGLEEEFRMKAYQKEQRVLIETERNRYTDKLCGYTDTYIRVLIDGPDELKGKLVRYKF